MYGKELSWHISQDKETTVWILNGRAASKLLFVILNFYLTKNEG
jgi:hypothetical protein